MEGGLRRLYWRGPTWINAAWLIWIGLRRLGLHAQADAMAAGLAAVVAREGFREYYEARLGYGMGAHDFGWSSLIAELVDPDRSASSSYLD